MVAVGASEVAGRYKSPGDFEALVAVLEKVDADTVAGLLKSLSVFEEDVPRDALDRLFAGGEWPVRSAAADYLAAKRKPWMLQLAGDWLAGEKDDHVGAKLRLAIG